MLSFWEIRGTGGSHPDCLEFHGFFGSHFGWFFFMDFGSILDEFSDDFSMKTDGEKRAQQHAASNHTFWLLDTVLDTAF